MFTVWILINSVDCKTVGFFLKISKEMSKAWRKSYAREAREPHTPVGRVRLSPVSLSVFSLVWLLARTWIRKNTDCFAVYQFRDTARLKFHCLWPRVEPGLCRLQSSTEFFLILKWTLQSFDSARRLLVILLPYTAIEIDFKNTVNGTSSLPQEM